MCKWFLKTFYINQRTLEKLVEVIEHEELLTYYGLSRTIILNEVEHAKKFNQIKVKFSSLKNKFSSIFPKLKLLLYNFNILFQLKDFTHEDKIREDTSLWKTWLKKYLNRIYDESKNIENHEKHRLSLMNSSNPRLKIKI